MQSLQAQLARRDEECQEERRTALQLHAQNFELEARARTWTASNIHCENARADLRISFDENRTQLIDYLGPEFEEKLQWEENEYHYHLTSEEQPPGPSSLHGLRDLQGGPGGGTKGSVPDERTPPCPAPARSVLSDQSLVMLSAAGEEYVC